MLSMVVSTFRASLKEFDSVIWVVPILVGLRVSYVYLDDVVVTAQGFWETAPLCRAHVQREREIWVRFSGDTIPYTCLEWIVPQSQSVLLSSVMYSGAFLCSGIVAPSHVRAVEASHYNYLVTIGAFLQFSY
ncbi:hypothetical protein MTO96_051522 [Rhipicephalus appendiculatus]